MESNDAASGANSQSLSNERPSCIYGSMCYRKNPSHRVDEAHPGDADYIAPPLPTSPMSAPECPYGNKCFRLNPNHIKNYSHPLNTNPKENLRKHRDGTLHSDGSSVNSQSDEDPFQCDSSDSEYEPGDYCD